MAIRIGQLEVLAAVADHGGLGHAGSSIGLTQSAVSKAIRSLEVELGCDLFERTRLGATPTPSGRRVIEHAREILRLVELTPSVADSHLPMPPIRLAAGATMASGLLPRLLRNATSIGEVVVLEGDDEELEAWLRDGSADLTVCVDKPPDALSAELVHNDPFVVVVPESHPLAGRGAVAPDELLASPIVLSRGSCGPPVRQLLCRLRPTWLPAHEARDVGTILALVRAGLGVCVLPELAVVDRSHGLRLLPLQAELSRTIYLARRSDATENVARAATELLGARY